MSFLETLKKRLQEEFLQIEKNPHYSPDQKVDRIIFTTASICAFVAIQPIPFADMPVLTSIQIFMGYKIAQVRGVRLSEEGAWEILKAIGGAVGLGFAAQQTAIGLYKLGLPGLGGFMIIPLVMGLTYGIGKAMDVYLKMKAQGKTPTIEEIKRAFESGKLEGKKTKPDPRYQEKARYPEEMGRKP